MISHGRRRLEVDEAGAAVEQRRLQTSISVTYTIVYDPDVVAISVDTIAETVTAAAEEAIDEGSFITALDDGDDRSRDRSWWRSRPSYGSAYTQAVADAQVCHVRRLRRHHGDDRDRISTEAPTFCPTRRRNMEYALSRGRQGSVAVSDLPACGCDDDAPVA